MTMPVFGYHVTVSAYGFWLPNDPRGSWSDFVGSWELFQFGPATKTDDPRSLARVPHDRHRRLAAKQALLRPPVRFTGIQARAVGRGFGAYVRKAGLPVWACAILPEHVHLVVGRSRLRIEQVVIQLKGAATRRLIEEGLHPFGHLAKPGEQPPKCWARGEWSVFLSTPADIIRSIRYVENNPLKEGKPPQRWNFVVPYQPPQ